MILVEVIEVAVTEMGLALTLKSTKFLKAVLMFVGPLETYSISVALGIQKLSRPLMHDLMHNFLESTEHIVNKVIVNKFQSGTFFAKIYICTDQDDRSKDLIFDARPSDAIALAVRFKAPIFIAERVYKAVAIDIKDLNAIDGDSNVEEYTLHTSDDSYNDLPLMDTIEPRRGSKLRSKRDVLNNMLETAVQSENYEKAALLRDELEELSALLSKKNKKQINDKPRWKS